MIPVIIKKVQLLACSFLLLGVFFSCKKIDNAVITGQPADFSKKVTASVNGFVTNENNLPVAGASVQYGESFSLTNRYGYFEIKNATVTENPAPVTVKLAGYFKGIKTFMAKAGKNNFCRIKLIPQVNAGDVDASSGGNVTLSNGLIVALPSNAVVDAVTKTAYIGTIHVSSAWLNPVANDLDQIMPGDLRGLNQNGVLKSLTTFGMAAVELTGNAGQLLQIADGKKATLTFPLPNTIAAAAPATIPLWYFDEAKGLWIEEGVAAKTGNAYVGDVKHFSYWNCDIPNATVPVSFTITDSAMHPLPYIYFSLTPVAPNSVGHISGYTDETGLVQVPVAANTSYKLQLSSNACTIAFAYTTEFSVQENSVGLGDIIFHEGYTTTISGTATDCNNNPLANGLVIFKNGYYFEAVPTNSDGSFSRTSLMCGSNSQITVVAQDPISQQESRGHNYTVQAGINNNLGNVQACGTSTAQFIDFTINGRRFVSIGSGSLTTVSSGPMSTRDSSFTTVTSYLCEVINNQPDTSRVLNLWFNMYNPEAPDNHHYIYENIVFRMSNNESLTNGNIRLASLAYIMNALDFSNCVPVNMTEYSTTSGEYVAGSYSGVFYGGDGGSQQPDMSTPYNISCSFRIRF